MLHVLFLSNRQRLIRNWDYKEISFPPHNHAKTLSHVEIFVVDPIGKFPIEMEQQLCQYKLNICHGK